MPAVKFPTRRDWMRMVSCVLTALAALSMAPLDTAAQPATPDQVVQKLADDVLAVIRGKDGRNGARRETLRNVFLTSFDMAGIGRFVLGRYWRTISKAQQAEYQRLFPEYVSDIYARQFARYSGETFAVIRTRSVSDTRSIVNAVIRPSGGGKIAVAFRVRRDRDVFRITDVAVEGASLIITKRDEFASVLRRQGMDVLLKRMRRQLERRAAGGD